MQTPKITATIVNICFELHFLKVFKVSAIYLLFSWYFLNLLCSAMTCFYVSRQTRHNRLMFDIISLFMRFIYHCTHLNKDWSPNRPRNIQRFAVFQWLMLFTYIVGGLILDLSISYTKVSLGKTLTPKLTTACGWQSARYTVEALYECVWT